MLSHAARRLLLRRAASPALKVPTTTRAHSTLNHRTFVADRGMYSRGFPEPAGEERAGAYVLDTRAGVGELLYQVEILRDRQKRQELLLWMCVASNFVFAAAFVYIAAGEDMEEGTMPPVKGVKRAGE